MDADYKEKKDCEICSKEFGIMRLRHKCKRCGMIVCSDCTKINSVIIGYKDNSQHKVCKYCENEISGQKNFKNENHTNWATMSKIGEKWLKYQHVMSYLITVENNYEYYLQQSQEIPECAGFCQEIEYDAQSGRFDKENFSFSMIEFLHYSQLGKQKDAIRKNIIHVLKAFVGKHPEIGYKQGLGHLTILLLCVLDEPNAFLVLSYIVEKILPNDFYRSKPIVLIGCMRENYVLCQNALEHLIEAKSNQAHTHSLMRFFEEVSPFLLQNFLIDALNFEAIIYAWDKVIETNNKKILEKTFFAMCNQLNVRNSIYSIKEVNYSKFTHTVTKFVTKNYLEKYSTIDIDENIRQKLEADFNHNIAQVYKQNYREHWMMLEAFSKFTGSDISAIKEEMNKEILEKRGGAKSKIDPREHYNFTKEEHLHIFDVIEKKIEGKFNKANWEKIFTALDVHKTNKISNKVVLSALMFLLPSPITEKIHSIFKLFEISNKDQLNKSEGFEFVEALYLSLGLLGPLNLSPYYYRDISFVYCKMYKKVNKGDKVKLTDFGIDGTIPKITENQFYLLKNVKILLAADAKLEEDMLTDSERVISIAMDPNYNGSNSPIKLNDHSLISHRASSSYGELFENPKLPNELDQLHTKTTSYHFKANGDVPLQEGSNTVKLGSIIDRPMYSNFFTQLETDSSNLDAINDINPHTFSNIDNKKIQPDDVVPKMKSTAKINHFKSGPILKMDLANDSSENSSKQNQPVENDQCKFCSIF